MYRSFGTGRRITLAVIAPVAKLPPIPATGTPLASAPSPTLTGFPNLPPAYPVFGRELVADNPNVKG